MVTNGLCQCAKVITRTWHLVDKCGNAAADQVQIITVNDNTPPSITFPAAVTVQCASDVPASKPTSCMATDNCSGTVTSQ